MITFRVFDDSVAAGLAKTVLDDHDIPCNLVDENSHACNAGFVAPIRLGPEWDNKLVTRLYHTIKYFGGTMQEESQGVAGSQEICTYRILLPEGDLTAVAETYMGLTLSGPEHLVRRIVTALANAPN